MASVKKAQAGKKLSVARTRQVADSLMKESNSKKDAAYQQRRIGQATVKNKVADKKVLADNYNTTLSGRDRLKIADKYFKEASSDSANAMKYRKLADKAEGKKPSMKKGGKVMLKRADGSVSQRGLWDNIRANKGSGKKPTAQMLKQEKKIKAQSKKK
jgi:hypothetical protein